MDSRTYKMMWATNEHLFSKIIKMKLFPLFSIAAAQFDYSYLEYNYTYIDTTVSPQVGFEVIKNYIICGLSNIF